MSSPALDGILFVMNKMNEKDLIYRTPHWEVRLNPNQKYLGRCVVILRRPCPRLAEVTEQETLAFTEIVRNLETLVQKTFGAAMFNWACAMNHAYQNNPPNPQVHWHLIPRYDRPIEFGGKAFTDEKFGYRSVSDQDIVADDLFEKIADSLRNNKHSVP